MYSILSLFILCLLVFGGLVLFEQPAEAARTVVTRTPYYQPNYNRFNHRYRHSYRPNRYYNNNRYNNRRYYNAYPRRRFFNNNHYYPTTSFSDMGALEKYTLDKTFSRDSDLQRLERLEMEAFGAIQPGDVNSRYDNVRTAILSRPKQNYKTSFWRNIGNFFGGQMTGFTPSLDNDPFFSGSSFASTPYPTTYGNSNITQFASPWGSGYRVNNYGTGSGCGVKILD